MIGKGTEGRRGPFLHMEVRMCLSEKVTLSWDLNDKGELALLSTAKEHCGRAPRTPGGPSLVHTPETGD